MLPRYSAPRMSVMAVCCGDIAVICRGGARSPAFRQLGGASSWYRRACSSSTCQDEGGRLEGMS